MVELSDKSQSGSVNTGSIFRSSFLHAVVILVVVFLVYSNTFNSPFVFDDLMFIVDNSGIKSLINLWPPSGTRWLGFFTFAMNYRLGGLNPFSYHVANLAIHMMNALLVYWLVMSTFKTPFIKQVPISPLLTHSDYKQQIMRFARATVYEPSTFVPFFTALLFACHPIQTQAVTYVWQRLTSLATMFYLLSLVLYIKARLLAESNARGVEGKEQEAKRHAPCAMLYACSLLSAVLAMKTKEISFTLPFIVAFYEFSFFSRMESSQRNATLKRFLYLLPFLLTLAIIPLTLLGPEWGTHKPEMSKAEHLRYLEISDLTTLSKYAYLLTQFRVIVTYIRLLFLPINQTLSYDYPAYTSFFDSAVFISVILHLSVLFLGVCLYMTSRRSDKEDRQWLRFGSFGILWFYVCLSVESSIVPIKDLIFEHRVYLPSIGFFAALTSGIEIVGSKWKGARNALACFTVLLVIVLSAAAYARNAVWKDSVRLWEDIVRKNPNKSELHNNLGVAYANRGYVDKAINEYATALKLSPSNIDARVNLGKAYAEQGHADKGVSEFIDALKVNPNHAGPHNNLGVVYANQGRTDDAINEFLAALKINSHYADAHYNLGNAYLEKGNTAAAIEEYISALKSNPDLADAHYNLGAIYAEQGRINESINEFQKVLRLNPGDAQARNYLKMLSERIKMRER